MSDEPPKSAAAAVGPTKAGAATDEEAAAPTVHHIIGKNIETIGHLHDRTEGATPLHQKMLERITFLVGRPAGLYTAIVVVAVWTCANTMLKEPFDPRPFPILQGLVTLAAFFTSIMVLARQNRQGHVAAKHAHLELQVNLLTEQKIAKLIGLVEELRRDLPNVRDRSDPMAQSMAMTTDPSTLMAALEDSSIGAAHHEGHR